MQYARCIARDGEADGIVLTLGTQGSTRYNHNLFGDSRAGDTGFRAPDNDTIGPFFDNMQVEIGINLLMRAQAAIPLYVHHRAGDSQVVFLNMAQKLQESGVIVGTG